MPASFTLFSSPRSVYQPSIHHFPTIWTLRLRICTTVSRLIASTKTLPHLLKVVGDQCTSIKCTAIISVSATMWTTSSLNTPLFFSCGTLCPTPSIIRAGSARWVLCTWEWGSTTPWELQEYWAIWIKMSSLLRYQSTKVWRKSFNTLIYLRNRTMKNHENL